MKKIWLCVCLFVMIGCSSSKEKGYNDISADEAYKVMQEQKDVVIVDVRTSEEYASGYIEHALNIPVEQIVDIETLVEQKDTTILVYCRSGNRSAKASAQLVDMGYTNVYDFGGINDWDYELIK